jgi:WD40 repeat protein
LPKENCIIFSSQDNNNSFYLNIWDIRNDLCIKTIKTEEEISSVLLLPNGRDMASLSTNYIDIWNIKEDFRHMKVIKVGKDYWSCGKLTLLCNEYIACHFETTSFALNINAYIYIFDCKNYNTACIIKTYTGDWYSLAGISNDMFASTTDKTIHIRKLKDWSFLFFNKKTWSKVNSLVCESEIRELATFYKNNKQILVSASLTYLKLWDMTKFQCIKKIPVDDYGCLSNSLMLPYGYMLCSSSQKLIYVYDLWSCQLVNNFKCEENVILSGEFKDNKIVSYSSENILIFHY